jgi:hypothetical protein
MRPGMRSLVLKGYGYHFDGDTFTQRPVVREIPEYKVRGGPIMDRTVCSSVLQGTQSLNSIGAKRLPPEMEQALKGANLSE